MSRFLSETGLATLWANVKTLLNTRLAAFGQKGSPGGLAELDETGKVPATQLPSYVDDVLEYPAKASFPATGESGKIYVSGSDNTSWRWSGTAYVQIKGDLALGETASTAYRGDRGKTAYEHSQAKHAPTTVATTSADGLMAAADKQKLDSLNEMMKNIGISGTLNLTVAETTAQMQAIFNGMDSNNVRLYLITDSNNQLPSLTGETYVTAHNNVAKLFGEDSLGANVGDIVLVCKFRILQMDLPVYKILPLNDAKSPNGSFPGSVGVMTPADKQNLKNAISNITTLFNSIDKTCFRCYQGEFNADQRLWYGYHMYVNYGRPPGSESDEYYVLRVADCGKDSDGKMVLHQTAYSCKYPEKVFCRVIKTTDKNVFTQPTTTYGEWKRIIGEPVTPTTDGLMTAADKKKLDSISVTTIPDVTQHELGTIIRYVGTTEFAAKGNLTEVQKWFINYINGHFYQLTCKGIVTYNSENSFFAKYGVTFDSERIGRNLSFKSYVPGDGYIYYHCPYYYPLSKEDNSIVNGWALMSFAFPEGLTAVPSDDELRQEFITWFGTPEEMEDFGIYGMFDLGNEWNAFIENTGVEEMFGNAMFLYNPTEDRYWKEINVQKQSSVSIQADLNKNVIVGAIRQHVGETSADFRQGMFYVGRDAEPPVAIIDDDYYAQYMQIDVETFAQKVENNAGQYHFYQEDAKPGVWYLNQGTEVNPAEFGLSNSDITYKPGGFTITFQPAKPARWELLLGSTPATDANELRAPGHYYNLTLNGPEEGNQFSVEMKIIALNVALLDTEVDFYEQIATTISGYMYRRMVTMAAVSGHLPEHGEWQQLI